MTPRTAQLERQVIPESRMKTTLAVARSAQSASLECHQYRSAPPMRRPAVRCHQKPYGLRGPWSTDIPMKR
jgi:hypothetical protein